MSSLLLYFIKNFPVLFQRFMVPCIYVDNSNTLIKHNSLYLFVRDMWVRFTLICLFSESLFEASIFS